MLTITFALFVLRHPQDPRRYVLVDEGKRGWWLPGGGVDGHETCMQGAKREAVEEAGVEVDDASVGLLKVELGRHRLRYILSGTAKSDSLKSVPDQESNGARWVTLRDTLKFQKREFPGVSNPYLRGSEPVEWFQHLETGKASYPLPGFFHFEVEPGTKGQDEGGRSAFSATAHCRLALAVGSTGRFVIDPSCTSGEIRLPFHKVSLETNETLKNCAERGLEELGFAEIPTGLLGFRDVRNTENELDLTAIYFIRIKSTKLKTASVDQFTDPFEKQALERACDGVIASLDILGTEE